MRFSFLRSATYWLRVISLGLVVGISIQFVQAWTAPVAAPPAGNVSGPLTIANASQTKSGGDISLGGGGNLYAGGFVAAPTLCIGSDCRTAWPGGGGGAGTWVSTWIDLGGGGSIDLNSYVPGAKMIQISAYARSPYSCCGFNAAAFIDGREFVGMHGDINGGDEDIWSMWGTMMTSPGTHTLSTAAGGNFYISGYAQ